MAEDRRTRGEQWSATYRNPTFDYERHQANTAILIGDVRRSMYIGITIVIAFALLLVFSGRTEAGINMFLIAGAPLLMIALVGEALRVWSKRGERREPAHVHTIFDQLADFDEVPDSPDGQHRHPHPR